MGYEDDIRTQLEDTKLTDEEKDLVFNAFIAVGRYYFTLK